MNIEYDEGYIITLENGLDYMLIHKYDDKYLAVELTIYGKPTDKYFIFQESVDANGDAYMYMMEKLSKQDLLGE